jgi:hypothetical protein
MKDLIQVNIGVPQHNIQIGSELFARVELYMLCMHSMFINSA